VNTYFVAEKKSSAGAGISFVRGETQGGARNNETKVVNPDEINIDEDSEDENSEEEKEEEG